MTAILIVNGELGTVPRGLENGLHGLEIWGMIETIQTTVVVISQNNEKSPRNFKRPAAIQILVKEH